MKTVLLIRHLSATGWLLTTKPASRVGCGVHPTPHNLLPTPSELVEDSTNWRVITELVATLEGAEAPMSPHAQDGESVGGAERVV